MFYCPELGRFLARDMIRRPGTVPYSPEIQQLASNMGAMLPIQESPDDATSSPYVYALSNPLVLSDPTGLYEPIEDENGREIGRRLGNGDILMFDPTFRRIPAPPRPPVFKGFERTRYQENDWLIAYLVKDFNNSKTEYCGCTERQTGPIPDLTPELLKSWMIQESGGNRQADLAAWATDPVQMVVPGDWDDYKTATGVTPPKRRNEGDIGRNLKAAMKWLCRKGFGTSGQPAGNRPTGKFDGWKIAFQRYGPAKDPGYAQRIIDRALNPGIYHKIEK